ncbi:MAG: choice-of-anchor D domain-containing protein, partial [Mycobacterium sp.]|nr:choice-of-anchor D domain-containing protein [Mycobacterium sp.]
VNTGLIAAANTSTVTLHGTIANTGGTVQIGNGATLLLDGGSLRGGTLTNAAGGNIVITTNSGTLASIAVTNAGTISVTGEQYYGLFSTLSVAGSVTLSGGGSLVLVDPTGIYAVPTSQTLTGVAAGDTLDNIDNTISGYGQLGAGRLKLINEAKGTIAATTSDLVVNTGSVALINHGLIEALGGTLLVQTVIDNTAGGTIEALNNGTVAGIVLLDGGTLRGGTIVTDALHPASSLQLTTNGGTLDGTAGAVTLAAASQAEVVSGETLVLKGAVNELGTLSVFGASYYGETSAVQIAGTLALSSGSALILADSTGINSAAASEVVTGSAAATLDNAALISGYGSLGAGNLKLINELNGTIDANGGNGLMVDAGTGGSLTNAGLLQALSSTLDVATAFVNTGIVISNGGTVLLQGSVSGTGKLEINGSAMTLEAGIASGQTILFGDFGGSETLDIAAPQSVAATFSGFASGDTVIVQNTSLTAANYLATTGTLGTLTLMAGTTSVGTLTLTGSYIQKDFVVQALADGTSSVNLISGIGTIYHHATASLATPNPIVFGQHHVGDTLSKTLTISNTGTAGAFTENLDASIGNATGAVTATGGFIGLAAGKTDTTDLTVTLAGGQDGVKTGSAVVTLLSDSNGVDGIGSTPLTSQTIAASGTLYNYATASSVGSVDFGIHHVGDKLAALLSIANTGTADGFTEKLDGSFGGTTGPATASGSFNGLAPSLTNSTSLTVGLVTTHDGIQSGSATLTPKSDGAGVDILGTHTLTTQSIGVTGTLYNYATASTLGPVNFGNHHVGDSLSQALTITNTGTADGFTEALDASIGSASTGVTATGAFSGLGASLTNTGSVIIGLASTTVGQHSGTAVVKLISDGINIDNLGTKALTAQTISASATLFALATPILSTGTLALGAVRVGGTLNTGTVTLRDGTVANAFQESLVYAASDPAGVSTTAGAGTIASGGSVQVGFTLSAATAGNFTGTTASLALASTGTGTSGLANTTLTADPVTLNAKVYAPAIATLGTTSLNFGIIHVGAAPVTRQISITNTGIGGLVDALTGGKATDTGNVSSAVFNLGTAGLAAAAVATLTLGITPTTAGIIGGTAVLGFASHDTDLADLAINGGTITVTGTIDNYATAKVEQTGGVGTLTQNGTLF